MSIAIAAEYGPADRLPRPLLRYRLRCSACGQDWTAPPGSTTGRLDREAAHHLDTCEARS